MAVVSPPCIINIQPCPSRRLIFSVTVPTNHGLVFDTKMGCSALKLLRHSSSHTKTKLRSNRVMVVPKATVETEDFIVEPATNVKFATSLKVPGCSSSLSLVGKGFREKKIVIVGVKVYAAAFYVDVMIRSYLATWSGKMKSQIEQDILFFREVLEAPVEKLLQIVLVRDIDGETFWSALDEALSPRLKHTGAAEQKALGVFRETFQGKPLKKGTVIYITWLQPSTMLVFVSSDGSHSTVDSLAVAYALFDVYFGNNPVSPSLKESVGSGLASMV